VGGHTDAVLLHTNLPSPFTQIDRLLTLKFEAPRRSGVKFVEKHFPGVELKIVDVA